MKIIIPWSLVSLYVVLVEVPDERSPVKVI